jgi:hypothetical protein
MAQLGENVARSVRINEDFSPEKLIERARKRIKDRQTLPSNLQRASPVPIPLNQGMASLGAPPSVPPHGMQVLRLTRQMRDTRGPVSDAQCPNHGTNQETRTETH